MDLAVPADHNVKLKESEKRDWYQDLGRELKKKLWNLKVKVIPFVIGALSTVPKRLVQTVENLEIGENHPSYSIIKISQDTEKNPGDFRRLAVTQIPLE